MIRADILPCNDLPKIDLQLALVPEDGFDSTGSEAKAGFVMGLAVVCYIRNFRNLGQGLTHTVFADL